MRSPSRVGRRQLRLITGLTLASVLLANGNAFAQIVVTTTAIPDRSLREAIVLANTTSGANTITFNIPGTGPFVITVLSTLPPFNDGAGVTVDGTTQPGYTTQPFLGTGGTVGVDALLLPQIRTPIIQVFGNGLAGNGLTFQGSNNSTLPGLHVWGFTGDNVLFDNSNNALLEQSLIGATAAFGDPGQVCAPPSMWCSA